MVTIIETFSNTWVTRVHHVLRPAASPRVLAATGIICGFDGNKGAIRLDYSFPLTRHLTGLVQYFSGYGESLLDYNRPNNRFSIGMPSAIGDHRRPVELVRVRSTVGTVKAGIVFAWT